MSNAPGLHRCPEFGKLPPMRRAVTPLVISLAAIVAGTPWTGAGADSLATPAEFAFPSSENSRAAWINQHDWLSERLRPRDLRIGDPVHIRIFKQSRELELYLQGRNGFDLFRIFPICDISGTLGPKRFEGDYQAPEGFYTIRPERLHPRSDFHLAFNLGYPNPFDRAMERTGSNIMIHGGCASNGCFAMTDYYMEQIYLLAEAALRNGQETIGVEIYPFRMTADNLEAHRGSRWHEFWRSLKPLYDYLLETGRPASVTSGSDGYSISADEEPGRESGRFSAP